MKGSVIAMMVRRWSIWFSVWISLLPPSASAIGGFKVAPGELRLLPPYCRPLANRSSGDALNPAVRKWESVFGRDYMHMHHYCRALQHVLKAQSSLDEGREKDALRVALGEFGYVEKHASENFILRHELYRLKSLAHGKLGDFGAAVRYAKRSVSVKPDYLKGWLHLADLHARMGAPDDARDALEKALRIKPESRAVQKRLACLSGKQTKTCPEGYSAGARAPSRK